jgi:hypothetical protein
MAQVNFPNYPKSPADIRSSDVAVYRVREQTVEVLRIYHASEDRP